MGRNRQWTKEDEKRLREMYPDMAAPAIAKKLNRTVSSIRMKAYLLHLNKSKAFLAQNGINNLGQYLRGHPPPNKGVKGWDAGGRSAETRFKKGHISLTKKPIGSERIDADGYTLRKISSTGHRRTDWQLVHILLWKAQHGAVPKGHVIAFKNGDKRDIRIDNLELISRAEIMKRNTIHKYPVELKSAIQIAGRLKKTIKNKMAKQQ